MFTSQIYSRLIAASVLALGFSAATQAVSLSVSPVTVTLDENKRTAAITLKNEGNEPRVIQTGLLQWTRENGEDRYIPSRDILTNPAIATLQPGQTQIIRVGLNRKVEKTQELAYRLYLSEVPPPPKESFTGLRVALRLGLAVFVSPKAKLIDRLNWDVSRGSEGKLLVKVLNSGNHHMRLINVRVRDPLTGRQLTESQQPGFVLLSGQSRQLSLPLPADWQGKQISLVASTDDGEAETTVELSQIVQ